MQLREALARGSGHTTNRSASPSLTVGRWTKVSGRGGPETVFAVHEMAEPTDGAPTLFASADLAEVEAYLDQFAPGHSTERIVDPTTWEPEFPTRP